MRNKDVASDVCLSCSIVVVVVVVVLFCSVLFCSVVVAVAVVVVIIIQHSPYSYCVKNVENDP